MSDGFQARVLGELDRLGGDVSGIRGDVGAVREDVAGLRTSLARIEERGKATGRRLTLLESWRDGHVDAAESTGKHQIRALRQQLAEEIKQRRVEATSRRKQVISFGLRGLLLTIGAILATLAPALARALGISP